MYGYCDTGCGTIYRRYFIDKRRHMGKDKEGVIFPVDPNLSEMSDGYLKFIDDLKEQIKKQRVLTVLNANLGMICLYWNIA